MNKFRLLLVLAVSAILSVTLLAAKPAVAASQDYGRQYAVPLAQFDCSYAAHFVADVTVPDNTVFAAGAPFTKTWRIQNDGSCTWGPSFPLHSLAFAGGTNLANTFSVELPTQVAPGSQVDVSIPMKAAIYPGRYISEWKLKVDNGPLVGFGGGGYAPIYVQIVVRGEGDSSSGICSYYTVRRGDWLGLIAMRYGTTWQAIAQANGLYNPNWVYAGMRLAIPCGKGQSPPAGQPGSYTSQLYHYTVSAPAGWTVSVNKSVPGSNPEYVSFSAPGSTLPQINIDVLTGTPPFTGYENCDKNLIFRGVPACQLSQPRGQNPAQQLLVFQRGNAYFHIAMLYEDASSMAIWDEFLRSFSFTD